MGHVSGGSADAVRMKYIPTGVSSPGVPAAISSQVPEVNPTPRWMPSRRSTTGHDARPPCRPLAAHTGRRCRLLTAAVRSGRMAPPAVLCADTPQSSRGQRSSRSGLGARLLEHRPLGMAGVAVACPLAPTGPHRRIGCVSRRPARVFHAVFRPTPHGDALALPWFFRLHAHLDRGLAPPRMTACTAHTQSMSRALQRVGSMPLFGPGPH